MRETRTMYAYENISFLDNLNLIPKHRSRVRELYKIHIVIAGGLERGKESVLIENATVPSSSREEGHSQSVSIWPPFPRHTQPKCDELGESLEERRILASTD